MSMKFTPAAPTRTRASPGPGSGTGRSTTVRTSGPPCCSTTTARTRLTSATRLVSPVAAGAAGPSGGTFSAGLGLLGPPATQLLGRRLLADGAPVQADRQEVLVRPPQERARLDAEDLGDLVPVQLGSHPRQLLLLAQACDAGLEVVVAARQALGLAHVTGGAVRPGELVQPAEQRAGVVDVAAHRRVGPHPGAVAVEAQVQLDQAGDRLHGLLVEAQRTQPRPGHLGTDDLVVVEAHPAVRLEPPGRRLADVVQEGGQA